MFAIAASVGVGEVCAVGYPISRDNLLRLQISELGPTRLEIEGEKIVDVFSYPEVAARIVLHPSGFVFVVPEEGQKHVYLTVVGEEGGTQDLRLRFAFKQPDPIRLLNTKQGVKNDEK